MDESRLKYNAEQSRYTKLRQFRKKYYGQDVFLHLCGDCKRNSMLLSLENCVLCGSTNIFYQSDIQVPDSLFGEITNDIVALESQEAVDIVPL